MRRKMYIADADLPCQLWAAYDQISAWEKWPSIWFKSLLFGDLGYNTDLYSNTYW